MKGLTAYMEEGLGTGSGDLPNRRIKSLTREEAFSLALNRLGTGQSGRDPTFFRHQRRWFTQAVYAMGFSNGAALAAEVEQSGYAPGYESLRPVLGYQANKILRFVRQEVSRLSRAKPGWRVVPKSPDLLDKYGAKVGQQLLNHFYQEFRFPALRRELATWMATCGMGYWHVDWDARGGKMVRTFKDPWSGQPLVEDQLAESDRKMLSEWGSYSDSMEGDYDVGILSPFQVKVPLGPTRVEDMPWMIITRLRSLDWFWDHYPEVAPELDGEAYQWSMDSHWWRRLASLSNDSQLGPAFTTGAMSDGIEQHELWIPPGGRLQEGLKVTFTNNHYLHHEPHPFKKAGIDLRYPCYPCYWFKPVGHYYGKGLVEDLIALQNDRNRARQDLNDHRDILSRPQIINPSGNNLTETEGTTGTIWEYDAGAGPPPTMWNPPAISQAHLASIEMDDSDMQEVAAMSDASIGNMPQGARSGNAVEMLQERDQDALGPSVASLEDGSQWVGEALLKVTHGFLSTERRVAIYGSSRQMDIRMFSGADIHGNTSVDVKPNSMMPRSAAVAKQRVMELLQVGAIDPNNPAHMRVVVKVFNEEVGDLETEFDLGDGHKRRADQENDMFLRPGSDPEFSFPDVEPHDDHVAHLEVHSLMMTTDDYELMPPIRKMAFLAHMSEHQRIISAMIQSQVAAQQATQGGGGGGSPPKEPGEASQPRQAQKTPGQVSSTS